MTIENYIVRIQKKLKDLPNYRKFNTLLLMNHDFDFIKKVYPNELKTFDDLNFIPHSCGVGIMGVIHFDNGQFASVVGGFYGSYGDGIKTFELGFDNGTGNIDVIGWLSSDEITEEMFKLQLQDQI